MTLIYLWLHLTLLSELAFGRLHLSANNTFNCTNYLSKILIMRVLYAIAIWIDRSSNIDMFSLTEKFTSDK